MVQGEDQCIRIIKLTIAYNYRSNINVNILLISVKYISEIINGYNEIW